jgi:transcriptional regulator with XRE-family HTH domain
MDKSIYTREYAAVLRVLRETRQQAGVTQVALAEKIDETQSSVSKIERGEVRLDIVQLRTICNALGVSLSGFVRRLENELANQG